MFRIRKAFDLCYGHRVWNQMLDAELAEQHLCACRHLHGHQGRVVVELEGDELKGGMVTDFHHLNWLKRWLDTTLDHKMVLDINDPILYHLGLSPLPMLTLDHDINGMVTHRTFAVEPREVLLVNKQVQAQLDAKRELQEGIVLVDFVPTSENLSQLIWRVVNAKMQHLCKVSSVEWSETPKTSAYYGE